MFKTFADWFQTSDKAATDAATFSHELAELVTALMVEAASADGQIGDNRNRTDLLLRGAPVQPDR